MRLLAGDPTAPADLFLIYSESLLAWLRSRFRGLDDRDLEEIAVDSVSRLAMDPTRYDPERGSLITYLHVDANGDALNALKRVKRHRGRQLSLETVELSLVGRNSLVRDESDPVDQLERKEKTRMVHEWADEHFTGADREAVLLMYAGERHDAVFARVFGLEGLPKLEQRRAVKRNKDRLKVRLKRLGVRLPNDG
jgi:RNA polymerase sigma-70 factor (ECF subfamily)